MASRVKRRRSSGHGRRRSVSVRGGPYGAAAGADRSPEGLPTEFVSRVMADLGAAEGARLIAALSGRPYRGLRVNSRFGDAIDLTRRRGWAASRLTWSPEGVLLAEDEDADPGDAALDPTRDESDDSDRRHPAAGHPWHDAGAYYLQDPSAMGVVPVLDPVPGERILDLAAAPGGKSTYIADRLGGTGLLWSHDVEPARAASLVGNLERWGASAIVVSHGPLVRLEPLRGTFDRVLLDAPCSGEGMFRKSAAALALWTPRRVAEFVALQTRLLDEAVEFLKPGGVLVYSTCTFGVEENEGAVESLLERRAELTLDDLDVAGASDGLTIHGATTGIGRASVRWWPHLHTGEGHFVARLRKESVTGSAESPRRMGTAEPGSEPTRDEHAAYEDFCRNVLGNDTPSTGRLRRFGTWLHLVPDIGLPTGLAPRRVGAPVGRVSSGRFTPHHALSRLLPGHGDAAAHVDLHHDDPRTDAYLAGAVIDASGPDGWLLVRADGFPLGWAKAKSGVLNNHYPKGLRRG